MPWKRRSANWCPLLRHQATAEHCKQFEEHHQCKLERHRQAAVQWWQRGAPHYKLQTLSEDDEQLLAGARRRADLWTKGFVQLRIPTAELGWRQNKLVARLQQLTTAAEGWADVLFEGFRKNGETVAPKGGLRTLKPLEDAELETLIREVIFHYFPDLADLGVWKPAGIATLTNAQSQFRHLDLEWISADGQHLRFFSVLIPTTHARQLCVWPGTHALTEHSTTIAMEVVKIDPGSLLLFRSDLVHAGHAAVEGEGLNVAGHAYLVPNSLLQNQSRLPTNQTLPLDDWVLQLTEDANQEKARAEKWEADITEGLLLPLRSPKGVRRMWAYPDVPSGGGGAAKSEAGVAGRKSSKRARSG